MEADKTYVLCEFLNEDRLDGNETVRPVQAGFSEWVQKPDGKTISDLIENGEEVTIKWPMNFDVVPKESFVKVTNGKKIEWKDAVAVLKAQADAWVDIVQASKNYVDFGKAFPSRQDRKELVKRKSDSTQSLSAEATLKRKKENHKEGKKKGSTVEILNTKLEKGKQKTLSIESDSESESDSVLKAKVLRQPDVACCDHLREIARLKDEMKLLTGELARFAAIDELNGDIRKLAAGVKDLIAMVKTASFSKGRDSYHKKERREKSSTVSREKDALAAPSKESFPVPLKERNAIDATFQDKHATTITTTQETPLLDPPSFPVVRASSPKGAEENRQPLHLESSEADTFSYSPVPGSERNGRNSESHSQEIIEFGRVSFPLSEVVKLRHGKVTILTGELLAKIFTPHELAVSSFKGKKNNRHDDGIPKQTLDAERILAMKDYIKKAKNIGDEADEEIDKAIKNKLNNFKKSREGKEILEKLQRNNLTP